MKYCMYLNDIFRISNSYLNVIPPKISWIYNINSTNKTQYDMDDVHTGCHRDQSMGLWTDQHGEFTMSRIGGLGLLLILGFSIVTKHHTYAA